MRHQTQEYLDQFLEKHPELKTCIEVGSLDVSGSIRHNLESRGIKYTATDMRSGPNVDIVINGHDLESKWKEEFDLALCFDTFEHDDAFWVTMEQLIKVTKPGGWVMVGAPSRWCPEHDHPHDYWRFMPQAMSHLLRDLTNVEIKVDKASDDSQFEDEIYAWGQKV